MYPNLLCNNLDILTQINNVSMLTKNNYLSIMGTYLLNYVKRRTIKVKFYNEYSQAETMWKPEIPQHYSILV